MTRRLPCTYEKTFRRKEECFPQSALAGLGFGGYGKKDCVLLPIKNVITSLYLFTSKMSDK